MQLWPAFMHGFPAAMGCGREQCRMCSERSSELLVRRFPQQNFLALQVLHQESPCMLLFAYVCQPYLMAQPLGTSYAIMPVC